MQAFCRRIACALAAAALLCACAFSGFAANEYMKDPRWKSVTGSEAAAMRDGGDMFVLFCFRASCGNSRTIGAKVLMEWMDTYGKDIYGVDVDAPDGVPSFVWTALGKTSATLPFVAFVRDGEVTAYSPEGDLTAFAETINDAFFAFYTDVTRVSLTIVTPPDKTVYRTGEPLDTTGMTLLAAYADGRTQTVTEGYTCTGFFSDTPGHRTVSVSYDGLQTAFTAAVDTPDGNPSVWVVQPAKTKLRYGNAATLTADFCNLPADTRVEWTYSVKTIRGTQTKSASGASVSVTAEGFSQTVTVTAAAFDADGSPILNRDGEAVAAQHTIRFQNNIFYRLQLVFDKLFGRSGCGSEV